MQIKLQSHKFSLIGDLMRKMRNCKYFSMVDINSAFWLIPLKIEDTKDRRQKKRQILRCRRVASNGPRPQFELKSSPEIFQRILSNIIRKQKLSNLAINYIYDILIFSKSFSEHMNHLIKLLKAIVKESIRLKFTKCTFAENSMKYLGHIIQDNTIRPLKDNLISIRNFPVPKTKKNKKQLKKRYQTQ